nr:MAG TPA: hypothetical protein [Caudoviricetes sp.]
MVIPYLPQTLNRNLWPSVREHRPYLKRIDYVTTCQ